MAETDDPDADEDLTDLSGAADNGGVAEALRAWEEGGHAAVQPDEGEISLVQFPQLEAGVPKVKPRLSRLNNVAVTISVELGRKEMTVRELTQLKEQDVIELEKLAGESFEIRVNGRTFALGEVVVVTDLVAVRITSLITKPPPEPEEE
ncbi:MAG: FliM/FliN family flagellar motor switch protein [Candidatus Latescibacterota bacterium]|jgi:flagellar motor switch protein FliN/FliY